MNKTSQFKESLFLGKWTKDSLDDLLRRASQIIDIGERIDFLSEEFIEIPYRNETLIGAARTPEVLVINLEAMDCFTFIDYVEAMRLSATFSEFKENLRSVRYHADRIAYETRNHFFSDWTQYNHAFVRDMTEEIAAGQAVRVRKKLNKKKDGTRILEGVPYRQRTISYIPASAAAMMAPDRLSTGDYAGIYSPLEGLDVSHVGIIIRRGDAVRFRHASSSEEHRHVVDEDLATYLLHRPGLVVLRPKEVETGI